MSLDSSNDADDGRVLGETDHHAPAEIAWVLLFLDGLLLACGALFWIMWGRFFDHGFYEALTGGTWAVAEPLVSPRIEHVAAAGVRVAGFLGAMASVFVLAISTTSFRRKERWAWYVMLTLPAFATLDFGLVAGYGAVTPVSVAWDLSLFALALTALALSYREFFTGSTAVTRRAQKANVSPA